MRQGTPHGSIFFKPEAGHSSGCYFLRTNFLEQEGSRLLLAPGPGVEGLLDKLAEGQVMGELPDRSILKHYLDFDLKGAPTIGA